MSFKKSFQGFTEAASKFEDSSEGLLDRLRIEIEFGIRFAEIFPDRRDEWRALIEEALRGAADRLSDAAPSNMAEIVREAEEILAPIGEAARSYTIHCCGHAHIDMNWMWPWAETVSVSHDTFATVDRLMDEFPDFKFSQSQASVYAAMEEYCPEIFEMIRKRVKEGRWEPTATMWVEGDKNLASGEILCRHLLYTKRYFKEKFGIEYADLKIDWEPDTFGHAHTLPTILAKSGVTRYYHTRTGPCVWLTWWQGPDGSRVLLFLDKAGYNGQIDPKNMARHLVDYVRETGLHDFLFLYGVGDHGGGPTRRDLAKAIEIGDWPIFPRVRLSTTDAYFSAVEAANPDLPVHDGELNFIFEGCYTSQSNVKLANRVSENIIPEAEALSVIAGAAAGFPYPAEEIRKGWRLAMFNQFHDILPGSGVRATYDYAQGCFQEIVAITEAIRTRAVRRLASRINTSAPFGIDPRKTSGEALGAGAGYREINGISAVNMGAVAAEPVIVFNQLPFRRSEMVEVKLWDKEFPAGQVVVRDDSGNETVGQVMETGDYWNHKYTSVVFPAKDVPATGYKTFLVERDPLPAADLTAVLGEMPKEDDPVPPGTVRMLRPGIMENEFVRVEIDPASGGIKHLIEKSTGYDFVPDGALLGLLEFYMEAPNNMSSWVIAETRSLTPLVDGGIRIDKGWASDIPADGGTYAWAADELHHGGPQRASVRIGRRVNESRVLVDIGLNAGSPMVDFRISADWREIGTRKEGTPMLRIAFPLRVTDPAATYEIPFGSISRPATGAEVPSLKWADLSGTRACGGRCGITMVNSSKYGHSADSNVLRLTLIRSSCDPDPVPEVGHHEIRLAILPHDGGCSISTASRLGASFNQPMLVAGTDLHEGELPSTTGFVEVLTPNVMAASVKKAEDSDAVVLRLYETDGKDTEARIDISRILKPGSSATEVDIMEQAIPESSARINDGILTVQISSHGMSTVMLG
jgi:alpha-mannosidase